MRGRQNLRKNRTRQRRRNQHNPTLASKWKAAGRRFDERQLDGFASEVAVAPAAAAEARRFHDEHDAGPRKGQSWPRFTPPPWSIRGRSLVRTWSLDRFA